MSRGLRGLRGIRGEKGESGDITFIRITNQEVYKELTDLIKNNDDQHKQIMLMLTNYKSNIGKLYLAITGIGILSLSTLGWFISSII